MYIIDEQILKMKKLNILMQILKQGRIDSQKIEKIISYQDFSILIQRIVEEIMKVSLQGYRRMEDSCSCQVKRCPLANRGSFSWKDNQIVLNEDVIQKLYSGSFLELLTIIHELNHFQIKYDILNGKISCDLIRILKERLLESSEIEGCYYRNNYQLCSEEKVVNIHAVYDFIILINHFDILLNEDEKNQLKEELFRNKREYQNYLRDVRANMKFNSNFIDFEEAFDIMLRYYYPEWFFMCPQLQIEYYFDGSVQKRTKEQLLQLLAEEKDFEKQEYIEKLLKGNTTKRLDETVFLKEDSFGNSKKDVLYKRKCKVKK